MPASTAPIRLTLASLLLLAAMPAFAGWTGKGEAGLAFASGNSDSRTANARVAATHKDDGVEWNFGLGGLYVRSDGNTTARRWEASTQARIDFYQRNFWYGGVRYEEDPFSGFHHQGLVTTGAGRRFFDDDRTRLLLQAGAGYKFLDPIGEPEGIKKHSFTGVASMEFNHRLTDTTTLIDRFAGEFTSSNNFLQNEVGVTVKMTDRVALSLAYHVRFNTDPPAGFEKVDTLTTVNLVYEVK
jgi:putative salt-induced outer membrane protein